MSRFRLRVLKGNPAKNLYHRLGFTEIQTLDNCYELERLNSIVRTLFQKEAETRDFSLVTFPSNKAETIILSLAI